MYVWIWRRLPGGLLGKLVGCTLLLVGTLALLFYLVFPWASPRLPFNDVTVNQHGTTAPASPGPSATAVPQ